MSNKLKGFIDKHFVLLAGIFILIGCLAGAGLFFTSPDSDRLDASEACADAYPSTVWADGIEGSNGAVWCYLTDDDGQHTVQVIGGLGMYRNKPYVADAEQLDLSLTPRSLCSTALPDSIYKWFEVSHSGNILCHMEDGSVYPQVVWLDSEGVLLK